VARFKHIHRAIDFLGESTPTIVLALAGTGFAISSFAQQADAFSDLWLTWPGRLLIISGLAVVAATVFGIRQDISRVKLLDEKRHVEVQMAKMQAGYGRIFSFLLKEVQRSLGTDSRTRISVYGHDGQAFVLLGRQADNPLYTRPGRPFFRETEGCIGMAWQDGEAVVQNLPDPDQDMNNYLNEASHQCKIPRGVVRKLNMKSRAYYSKAMNKPGGGNRIAVLVVESRNPTLPVEEIRGYLSGPEGQRLSQIIDSFEPFEPQPSIAAGAGF
jgi:hypothetical protein